MRFLKDTSGNFATMTAVLAVPLLMGVSMLINVGYAYRDTDNLQNALDSGLLAAGKFDGTLKQKQEIVMAFLKPQIRDSELRGLNLSVAVDQDGASLHGTVMAKYPIRLFNSFSITNIQLKVESAVASGSGKPVDVALVLDNTASLGADGLRAVKDAAQSFADTLFAGSSSTSNVHIGVVPFAGAVNVGRDFRRNFLDISGDADYQSYQTEYVNVAKINPACVPNYGGGSGGGGGAGTVEGSLRETDLPFDYLFQEILGVRPAYAAETAQDHGFPAGYFIGSSDGCDWVYSPKKIANLDLFAQISNVSWGGCVEARTEPYDTSDIAPRAGDANTLFVPYFAPDEPDLENSFDRIYNNNYMADANPVPWTPANWAVVDGWGAVSLTTKYSQHPSLLNAGGQYQSGPNLGCPQPLLPLSNNKSAVTASINSMSMPYSGGTLVSEGAAWGWRVLSPGEPFTEANKDKDTQRIMVIMSDGQNEFSRNPKLLENGEAVGPVLSDYTAYGFLRGNRLVNNPTFDNVGAELDNRLQKVCTAAKRDGIEIYTVLFKSDSQRAINALKSCASEDKFFYRAIDAAELKKVFSEIATRDGAYRLVK